MKGPVKKHSTNSLHRFEARTLSGLPLPNIEIKTILVPLDFSPASIEALSYAVPLAKKFGAALHLVHVSDKENASEIFPADELRPETVERIEFLHYRLALLHEKHLPASWAKHDHVRAGQAYEQICDLAREMDAGLIVIGTRGHAGLERILLGSTAERVVRFASRPVLVVRRRERKQPKEFILRNILAPIDFSQCAMSGAMYGAFFAKTFDAKLLLLHVFAGVMSAPSRDISKALKKNDAMDLENARLDMEAFTQLDFLRTVRHTTEIRAGYAVDEICRKAQECDTDLVTIATHGRTGFNRMLLGSVAEHVVRYAECPVLVVPVHPPAS